DTRTMLEWQRRLGLTGSGLKSPLHWLPPCGARSKTHRRSWTLSFRSKWSRLTHKKGLDSFLTISHSPPGMRPSNVAAPRARPRSNRQRLLDFLADLQMSLSPFALTSVHLHR